MVLLSNALVYLDFFFIRVSFGGCGEHIHTHPWLAYEHCVCGLIISALMNGFLFFGYDSFHQNESFILIRKLPSSSVALKSDDAQVN